jgi:hypothetical protein
MALVWLVFGALLWLLAGLVLWLGRLTRRRIDAGSHRED